MVTVRRRGGDAAWFDGDCRRAFELKQSAYHRWCRNRSAENWDLFCQARGTSNRLYAAAKARYSFDSKQSRDIVELPQTCHPRPAFCGIAFRAREVERYLLDLDPNCGVDPSGCFPMFFQKTASILAPKLSCLFRRLLRGGEFPLEWRIADVTPISKVPYRRLSATIGRFRLHQFCRKFLKG